MVLTKNWFRGNTQEEDQEEKPVWCDSCRRWAEQADHLWKDMVDRGRGGPDTTRLHVHVDNEALELIDEIRGDLTRTKFIRRAIDKEIGRF